MLGGFAFTRESSDKERVSQCLPFFSTHDLDTANDICTMISTSVDACISLKEKKSVMCHVSFVADVPVASFQTDKTTRRFPHSLHVKIPGQGKQAKLMSWRKALEHSGLCGSPGLTEAFRPPVTMLQLTWHFPLYSNSIFSRVLFRQSELQY